MFTASCSQEPVDGTRFLFNTICTLTVYSEENPDESAEEIIEGAFDLCEEYENKRVKNKEIKPNTYGRNMQTCSAAP